MKNFVYLFLLITIVLLPNWIYYLFSVPPHPLKETIGQLLGAYFVTLTPLILFGQRYKYYLAFLGILGAISLPLEIGFFHLYHNRLDLVSFSVLAETNFREAIEFISGYSTVLLSLFILYILLFSYLYRHIEINNTKLLRIIGIVSLAVVLLLSYRSQKLIQGQSYFYTLYKNVITNKSPWLLFRLGNEYAKNKIALSKYKKIHDKFKFHAYKIDKIPQLHILIIGESSRFDHWSINGYQRNTNPHLEKVNNLISLSNVITGAGATNWAVPLMITPATAKKFDISIKTHSVLGAFKEAGYETYWISNQDRFPYLDLHAQEAQHIVYIKDKTLNAYDEAILPYVQKAITNSKNKNIFIVLHIMGNHWKYDERYPKKFDNYQPSIKGKFVRMDDFNYKKSIINSYDNSILYAEYILYQIIKMVNKTNTVATVNYISDHAENLYDTDKHLFGHKCTVSQFVDHIPWFIWYSKKYQTKYRNKIKNLEKNKNKMISSANNAFYTILDFGQIEYKNMDFTKSIISDNFKFHKRYVLSGSIPVDYDAYIKSHIGCIYEK